MGSDGLMEYVEKYRVYLSIIGFLAVLLAPFVYRDINSPYYLVRMDYIVWFTTIIVLLCTIMDLKYYCSKKGLSLTLILEILGLMIVVIIRFVSIIHSLIIDPDNLYIGGLIADYIVLKYTIPIMILGSFISMSVMIIHRISGEPKALLSKELSCLDLLSYFNKYFEKILRHPIILAFFIGFLIRLLPEIQWWPYPIGWDTIEYIAHLRDYILSPGIFRSYFWMGGMRNIPPLLDLVLYPFARIVDPWYVFKFYPPIMYGLLIALMALFSKEVLKLDNKLVIVIAFVAGYNLLLLRLTWDLHKQFLGTVLFFAAVIVLEKGNDYKNHIIALTLLLLSSLATEIGAGLTIILSLIIVIKNILEFLEKRGWKRLVLIASYIILSLISYLLILWYLKRPAIAPSPVTGAAPPVIRSFLKHQPDVFAYIIISYGTLVPLLLIGLDSYRRKLRYSVYLVIIMLILVITPWLMPYTEATLGQWDRFLMTTTVFTLPIALSQLRILRRRALIATYILVLILPGFYATMSPGFYRYNDVLVKSLYRMPGGLSPAPVPTKEFDMLLDVASHVRDLDLSKAPIITYIYYGRFVHLEVRDIDQTKLVNIGHEPTLYDVCWIMHRFNKTSAYILIRYTPPEMFNRTVNAFLIDTKREPILCGPYNTTDVSMFAKPVYYNDKYIIFYIKIQESMDKNK